jgi:hypothetical protein
LPSFYVSADTTPLYLTNTNGVFNLTFDNGVYALGSTSKTDPITSLCTISCVPSVEFDITFQNSAPPLLNAGLGSFFWAGAIQHQWSIPAGRVSGSLIVDNKTLAIDPEASLTWYDRQFGLTAAQNFTWFGLRLNSGKRQTGAYVLLLAVDRPRERKQAVCDGAHGAEYGCRGANRAVLAFQGQVISVKPDQLRVSVGVVDHIAGWDAARDRDAAAGF